MFKKIEKFGGDTEDMDVVRLEQSCNNRYLGVDYSGKVYLVVLYDEQQDDGVDGFTAMTFE